MIRSTLTSLALAAIAAGLASLWSGCDSSVTSADVITVDPASATLVDGKGVVVFTAAENAETPLFLPLEWSVSNPALGTITGSEGLTAVYAGAGVLGANTITVRDQGHASGIAVVYQEAADDAGDQADDAGTS